MALRADRCELPSGLVLDPYYVAEEKEWVHVFAQDEHGAVLIVRQFRYPVGAVCAELPGGIVDPGETELDAARRELLEETGHVAERWTPVGQAYANAGRQTNRVHVFRAQGLSRHGPQCLDASEDITFEFASVAQIQAMIDGFEFSQAMHIASFYRALHAGPH
jgi:8-oxo-dGTP pyrophosphatase MutT (NUDIX family)